MLASVLRDVWPQTFTLVRAGSLPEAEARLDEGGIDCVLVEPAGSAAAPLERLCARAPALPVVVLTDEADEACALRAVRAGAQDVLAKGADGGAVGRALLYAVERKRAEQALLDVARLHEAAMLALGEGVLVLDAAGRVTAANPAAARLLRVSPERLDGLDLREARAQILDADGAPLASDAWPPLRVLATGEPEERRVLGLRHRDGREVWATVTARPLQRAGEARPYAAVVSVADVTDLRETAIDAVTGLWDARRFAEELERALAHAVRYRRGGALLVLELAPPVTDEDLGAVAAALAGRLRRTDVLGRIGPARFGVILPHVDEGRARQVAHALGAMLAEGPRPAGATLGTTPLPETDTPADELLALALGALDEARAARSVAGD